MKVVFFAVLAGAALLGTTAQAGATNLYPDEAPQVSAERPAPRLNRARTQCTPSGPEGSTQGPAQGFEAKIDRGFGSVPAIPGRVEERRAAAPAIRLVGAGGS